MSTNKQLMINSEAQEEMARQYNEAKSQSKAAYEIASEAEKAADAKYKSAKRQIPQDTKTMEEAKAEKAKAKSDKEAARKIMDDYYEKEKAFNNSQKSRIIGQGDTKQDTIDRPTDTENLSETKESKAGSNTSSDVDNKTANNTNKSKSIQLGQSFYDNVASAIRGGKKGNALDSASKTAKEQAQNYRNRSAMNQMEAQRAQQIANQNPYSEAGKIASVQNDAENRQIINNTSFSAGTAAARLRKTNTPDIQSQIAREDQQQDVANQRRDESNTAQEENTAAEGDAEEFAIRSRDLDNDRAESANLSMGTPDYSEDTDTVTDNTVTDNTGTDNTVVDDAEPQEQPMPAGDAQHVINWLLGSSLGQDISPQDGAEGDNGLAAWVVKTYGVQPAALHKYNSADPTAKKWEQMWLNDSSLAGDKKGAILALRQGRAGEGQDASKNFTSYADPSMNHNMQIKDDSGIISDAYMKDIISCLSDMRLKSIREAYDRDGCCSPEDFLWLAAHTGGKFNHNGHDYDFFNDDDWADDNDSSVLSGYADYIKNYVYTYKPEATEIDSRIDPNQEHIGPMAQDIEKVNPACVKETPEGIKTVDTARLAMMNAGAIGDLARQMQDLVDKLKTIGVE